ncbi:MAG: NAD-glutamate dehydrogenase [Actinomycetota bacterium]|nr:NAD-glutamate dehydrogenase [Actinomycetota bacterium]
MSAAWTKAADAELSGLPPGDTQFLDALRASFDSSFQRLFGPDRLGSYMRTTLELARKLGKSWYAFDISFGPKPSDGEAPVLLTVDVASVDQAFLVDSFVALLRRFGLEPVASLHPLVTVARDAEGNIVAAQRTGSKAAEGRLESYVHFDVEARHSDVDLARLNDELKRVFTSLEAIQADKAGLSRLVAQPGHGQRSLPEGMFLTLGAGLTSGGGHMGIVSPMDDEEAELLRTAAASGDGLVLAPVFSPVVSNETIVVAPAVDGQSFVAGLPSRTGEVDEDTGLLHSLAASLAIPPESYSYRELDEVLHMVPAIELALVPQDHLYEGISALLLARETNQIAVYASAMNSARAVRVYAYIPTIRYHTGMDRRIRAGVAARCADCTVQAREAHIDAGSARVDVDIALAAGGLSGAELVALVSEISESEARTWLDRLEAELTERLGEEPAAQLCPRYEYTFDSTFQNDYSAEVGADDVQRIESALAGEGIWVGFTTEKGRRPIASIAADSGAIRLRIIHTGQKQKLSALLPLVETFGLSVLEEVPYQLASPENGSPIWLYDLGVELGSSVTEVSQEYLSRFAATFSEVFLGELDADLVNSLVLTAGVDTYGVLLLRTLANYQRFTAAGFSPGVALDTIAAYPEVARALVDLFAVRFEQKTATQEEAEEAVARAHALVDQVQTLEHDQFFRLLVRVIQAVLRTNLYVRSSVEEPVVIKLDSSEVPGLPEPVPAVEAYVFAPIVEGIHLRSSLVARGGIRYSDRKDDYRTEILGLMKAQAVKNAVIVPHGAKGGFVLRTLANDDATVKRCYDAYISSLLSITDNIVKGQVIHPAIGPVYDGEDPYLVVAADKGTATFSDRANAIALVNDFWLGDAFASGGSAGYDHKAIGITAKGAWISVRHHFASIGIDPEIDPITVVGVGDMSGDVFGNGMLLSKSMRLVAAFDHRHIFLDPNPDPATSWAERKRLFDLPRSSWEDYDTSLVSAGGGVFKRSVKSIQLSEEAARAIGVEARSYSPIEVMRAILSAPVDLLWNGGIGTYFRASTETNADIGDKTNDALRIAANQVRAKVIGEGGNLGLSQLARVELSQLGILVNTDAIDNSAGVDTSDHEVNLKILYQHSSGLAGLDRDKLLNALTGEVENLVLADNTWQNWALSMASAEFAEMRGTYAEFVTMLEEKAGLDRAVEFIPSADQIVAGYDLTRPELSVLLAYEKLRAKSELVASNAAEAELLSSESLKYFPAELLPRIASEASSHPLWPQLVSNYVANEILNMLGPTYLMRSVEESGLSLFEVAKCFFTADAIFGSSAKLREIMADRTLPFEALMNGFLQTARFHERATRWLMRDPERAAKLDLEHYRSAASELVARFSSVLTPRYLARYQAGMAELGDSPLFDLASQAGLAVPTMEVISLAGAYPDAGLAGVAKSYFEVGEALAVPDLLVVARHLPRATTWERQVRIAIRDDIDSVHTLAFRRVMKQGGAKRLERYQEFGSTKIAGWLGSEEAPERSGRSESDLLAMLVVATRSLRSMVESS